MEVKLTPLPPLVPVPGSYWVTRPHTKLERLLQASAVRGSAITRPKSLAGALGLSAARINQCFGRALDTVGARVPFQIAAKLAEVFAAEGVTFAADWLYQDLTVFDLYLAAGTRVGLNGRATSWFDLVRHNAKPSPSELLYERRRGLRIRPNHAPVAAPEPFEIGERAHLVLRPINGETNHSEPPHGVILIEDDEKTECAFPETSGNTLITGPALILELARRIWTGG
jgi:hypothetical protein